MILRTRLSKRASRPEGRLNRSTGNVSDLVGFLPGLRDDRFKRLHQNAKPTRIVEYSRSTTQIAIVGGGAGGSLLAAQLLRQASAPFRILLIERARECGHGVAYSTRCPDHLLNVPAGHMSAYSDVPEHFVRWLKSEVGRATESGKYSADDFVPRHLFGRYVQRVLAEAKATAAPGVELEILQAEVVDIEEQAETLVLHCSDGRTLSAERAVLAIGNLPGEYPIQKPLRFYESPRYVHVPWQSDAFAGLNPSDDILLVGHGLTATDLIVQFEQRGHHGTIHALSRRGIRPQVHRTAVTPQAIEGIAEVAPTVRAWTRKVIAEVEEAEKSGQDWRTVIDGLRPHTQAIWKSFSWDERARFMRHIRPIWDALRHRIPPPTAQVIERLEASGRLKFYAGRLQALEVENNAVQALIRRRGSINHLSLRVAKVINCTGARTDYTKYQHPLLVHLLARGLIGHDLLALGINALPTGEVIRYRGEPNPRLFTLGAPLKGVLWESTAIPEIREQAEALARRLVELQPALTPQTG
jgi:uncharacterized NAD(P)/FAD-binding protein YdhS